MHERIYNNFKVRQHRKILRHNSTLAEDILWDKIRRKQILNTRFRRQVSIGNYITDFFNFELKLAIEVDGKDHNRKIQEEYDAGRQEILEGNSIIFLRIKNEEIFNKLDMVLEKIKVKIIELRKTPFVSP